MIAVLAISCAQKKTRDNLPTVESAGLESTLVSEGDSSQGVFSPSSDRFLFVSRARPGHAQAQVYEKILASGEETRITFQNGDTSFPQYSPKADFILYASTTDELKENPPLLNPTSPETDIPAFFNGGSEIYLHSRNGLDIQRFTDFVGFDGEARFSTDGKSVTWTRRRGNRLETLSEGRADRKVRAIKGLGENIAQYIVAPDGKTKAWVDWDKSFGVARLKVQKGGAKAAEVLPDFFTAKTDLIFSSDSQWLFWSQWNAAGSVYQLWSLQLDNLCARRLSDNGDHDRRFPSLSPDLQAFTFTVQKKERSRISQVKFAAPAGPCATSP